MKSKPYEFMIDLDNIFINSKIHREQAYFSVIDHDHHWFMGISSVCSTLVKYKWFSSWIFRVIWFLLFDLLLLLLFFPFFTFKQRGHTFSWQKLLKSTAVSGGMHFPSLRGHYGQMDLWTKTYSSSVNKHFNSLILLLAFL